MLLRRAFVSTNLVSALIAATAANGGCMVHGRAKPFAYVGAGAVIVTGGVMLRTRATECTTRTDMCDDFGIPTERLIGGTLLTAGAIVLALQLASDLGPEPAPGAPPVVSEPDPNFAEGVDLRVLTDDARDSARAGQCRDVRAIGSRVDALSWHYYRTVFEVDRDIAGCL